MTLPITLQGEPHISQRVEMISLALKEKAPKLFRKMKQEKSLPKFLKDQEKMLMETYLVECNQVMLSPDSNLQKGENPIEQLQRIEMALKQIWNETLETYLEFSDQIIK